MILFKLSSLKKWLYVLENLVYNKVEILVKKIVSLIIKKIIFSFIGVKMELLLK